MAPVLPRLGLSLTSILVLFAVKAERKKHNKTVYLKIKGNVVLDFLLVVVQSLSHVWLLATPCTAARQASLFFTISQRLLKLMSIESMMLPNHLILCCPLVLLDSIFPSISLFQWINPSPEITVLKFSFCTVGKIKFQIKLYFKTSIKRWVKISLKSYP